MLGKEFAKKSDTDESCINKVILANINMKLPEEGEKIKRLVEIALERNIDYKPSSEAYMELNLYCDRKGLENPLHKGR